MIRDIYTEKRTGTFSTSKLWRNVASAVATFCVIWITVHGTLGEGLLMVYLAGVGGIEAAHRWMERKAP